MYWGDADLAGRLFPVVPAGTPFPVGPVGLCGMQSPFDFDPVGPYVGPCGTQSPSVFEPVGPDGPYVGPCGTLSPSDSEPVGPDGPYVGPCGTQSPSDSELVGTDGLYVGLLARLTLNLLAQMARMLALLACVGRCPHLTLNLWPVWDAVPV